MTYAPRHDHPPERDLLNFARDELGEAKKERIIRHCRQCPECAERLIELTREHAPDAGPFRLTRFQKISIVLLILSLVAAIGGLMWTLQQVAQQPGLPAGPEMPLPDGGPAPDADDQGRAPGALPRAGAPGDAGDAEGAPVPAPDGGDQGS